VRFSLLEVPCGQEVTLMVLHHEETIRRSLMEMGFVPGSVLRKLRVAPFGDPIVIGLRGTQIAIRSEDLRQMEVELV
jgi:ferrous iron transport protein A